MAYFNLTNELFADFVENKQYSEEKAWELITKIKERFVSIEKKDYWVVGYGSILNERSRNKTFLEPLEVRPAYVRGWNRIFNLDCKTQCVLNVEPATPSTHLPVVAVKVPYTDMYDFILRECNYDLVEVKLYDYDTKKVVSDAIMVVAPDENTANHFPNMNYVQANIYGAMQLGGETFVDEYLSTTSYIGKDGTKKSISEYITSDALEYFKTVDSNY